MCIYLICIGGFNYGIGGDKFVYMQEFQAYPTSFDNLLDTIKLRILLAGEMPAWTLLNLFCKVVFGSFYAVQLILAICINVCVCWFAARYTKRYFLFLILYFFCKAFFWFNMENMRESFSIALCLIAFEEYLEKKYIKYILLVICALTFHFSAALALLFPLLRLKLDIRLLPFLAIMCFVIWISADLLMSKLFVYAAGFVGIFAKKALFYFSQKATFFGFLNRDITYVIIPFIVSYFGIIWNKDEKKKQKMRKYYALLMFTGCLAASFDGNGFYRPFNYAFIFYLAMAAENTHQLVHYKPHLILRACAVVGIFVLQTWFYLGKEEKANAYVYQMYFPFTTESSDPQTIELRKIMHEAAVSVDKETTRDIKE